MRASECELSWSRIKEAQVEGWADNMKVAMFVGVKRAELMSCESCVPERERGLRDRKNVSRGRAERKKER